MRPVSPEISTMASLHSIQRKGPGRPKNPTSTYTCTFGCGAGFGTKSACAAHESEKHGVEWHCTCGAKFNKLPKLAEHTARKKHDMDQKRVMRALQGRKRREASLEIVGGNVDGVALKKEKAFGFAASSGKKRQSLEFSSSKPRPEKRRQSESTHNKTNIRPSKPIGVGRLTPKFNSSQTLAPSEHPAIRPTSRAQPDEHLTLTTP